MVRQGTRSSRGFVLCAGLAAVATLQLGSRCFSSGVPPQAERSALEGRRGLLAATVAAASTGLHSADAASAPSWPGRYLDPNHPGCKREVSVEYEGIVIEGADGEPGCLRGEKQTPWRLAVKPSPTKADELLIDFSPKGGPKDLVGKWDGDGILFPDGNKWKKVIR
mmetsp:Transcript_19432/g.42456  ORF Transcript_19432/g.42456 Transcript_19432/m.42456 type:complete len:166 (-) Transcript_19432:136-633(-)